MATTDRTSTRISTVRNFLGGIYGPDLHAKRINALSAATLGVMTGASLAVAAIGQALALALARGLTLRAGGCRRVPHGWQIRCQLPDPRPQGAALRHGVIGDPRR